MSIFDSLIETEAEEVARLMAAPAGSDDRRLAELPVTVPGHAAGLVLELPLDGDGRLVVVPVFWKPDGTPHGEGKVLHSGFFECMVVHSTCHGYRVGRIIVVPVSQIRRARIVNMDGGAR